MAMAGLSEKVRLICLVGLVGDDLVARTGEGFCTAKVGKLTVSGSRGCSTKAENSTSLSLCVAMARPSHGGGGATSVPVGTPTPGTPLYPAPGNGFTLWSQQGIVNVKSSRIDKRG